MTNLDALISAALEAEVREVAMSVDTGRRAAQLEDRLDSVDRRRRWLWASGLAAAAVAAVIIALVVGGGLLGAERNTAPVTPPEESTVYSSENFPFPFRVTLPAWTASSSTVYGSDKTELFWNQSDCSLDSRPPQPCADDEDFKIRVLAPQWVARPAEAPTVSAAPDYADYVAYLHEMAVDGYLDISDETTTSVDGRAATVLTLSGMTDQPGAIACVSQYAARRDCGWGLLPGLAWRLAVLDQPQQVVLVWLRVNEDRADRAEALADLDQLLTTWRWTT